MTSSSLVKRPLTDIIAWCDQASRKGVDCEISVNDFIQHVTSFAEQLPDLQYAINLCTNRYAFLVSFCAVIIRGQTNLLPPSQAIDEIKSIVADYSDSYCIVNDSFADLAIEQVYINVNDIRHAETNKLQAAMPEIQDSHIAAVAFTSGSEGIPKANDKRWIDIISCAELAIERFELGHGEALISTVPSQHMYGLETSILFPLVVDCKIYNGQPFYPENIRMAIEAIKHDHEAVLISTPVHLKACVKANIKWAAVKLIISAAATLPQSLARDITGAFNARLKEIYGCTEAGSMATRETVLTTDWLAHKGVSFYESNDTFFVKAAHLPEDVALSDVLKLNSDNSFELLGRNSELIKVAGKRGHISDLNAKLLQIAEVKSGVFYLPDNVNNDDGNIDVQRLVAFVVAPKADKEVILQQLAKKIDPAFMPRPLYVVDALPFTSTGKLPRKQLQELYVHQQQTNSSRRI